jgi:amidase
MPFEAGVLDLCRCAVETFEFLGCSVEEAVPDFPIDQLFAHAQVLRSWQLGAALIDLYKDPAKRAQLSEEAQFEVEIFLKLGASDISAAATVRSAWYQAVRRFFEEFDYFILPSAQVFPFDAKTRWPKEIAGREMDAYNRWMEVMVPVTMAGCPAVNVPAGFNANGVPMGLQIMGPNHAERSCLELAYAYDQVTRWVESRPPPMLSLAMNSGNGRH